MGGPDKPGHDNFELSPLCHRPAERQRGPGDPCHRARDRTKPPQVCLCTGGAGIRARDCCPIRLAQEYIPIISS